MKTQLYHLLMFLVLVLVLPSCGKDDPVTGNGKEDNWEAEGEGGEEGDGEYEDDKESFNGDYLIGNWVLTNLYLEDEYGHEQETYQVSDEEDVIQFMRDGSCRNFCVWQDYSGQWKTDYDDVGSWNLKNDQLRLLYYGCGQQTVTLNQLTSNELSFTGYVKEERTTYKMTYRKVDKVTEPGTQSEDPEQPDDPTEEVPDISFNTKTKKVYPDQFILECSYGWDHQNSIKRAGFCWSTRPNPTILDESVFISLTSQSSNTKTISCKVDQAGTDYYVRAFAQINGKFIYFDDLQVQTVGKDIQLKVRYDAQQDKIAVDYDIRKDGIYSLYFYANLTMQGDFVKDLGGVTNGDSGTKYVVDYTCYRYYAYVVDLATDIEYHSNTVTKKYPYY